MKCNFFTTLEMENLRVPDLMFAVGVSFFNILTLKHLGGRETTAGAAGKEEGRGRRAASS